MPSGGIYNTLEEPKRKLSKKDEHEILELLQDYWQEALDDQAWREAREEMIQCFDYKENRQWTDQELKDLKQRGQPPTVNNQVKVTVDRIVGQFVQMKTKTVFKPRNGVVDSPVADTMSDIYNYIRQCSGLEFEERDVVEDGATGGFGVFEVCLEDDGPLGKEVKVKAEDCFNVIPDPRHRRYDWNEDARYICRYKWVDRKYAKQLYPDKKRQIESLFSDNAQGQLASVDELRGEAFVDYKRDRIRLVEVEYKKRRTSKKYIFDDGKVFDEADVDDKLLGFAEEAGQSYETKDQAEEQICVGVFSDGVLFEHGVSKRKRYKFVPYYVNRKKSGAPYSMITTAIPIQDAINKRESKALSLLTLNQSIFEKGAIDSIPDLKKNMAQPDGAVEINEGFFERFRVEKNLELAQSRHAMHMASKQDFRQVTGVNPDAMGEKSEVRSGVGIQRKVAMTGLIVAPIFDNFKRTREALAKTIHDAVVVGYTPGKIMTITDNPESTRQVALDEQSLEAVKQAKYDVIVSEIEDLDTINEQQQEMIMRNLPAILQYGPGWGEVLFDMSSIRNKDEIKAKIAKIMEQNKTPNAPKMTLSVQMETLAPIERAFFYQQMGADPAFIQQMMAQAPPPSQVLQAQAQLADNQINMQTEQMRQEGQMRTEGLKQQTEAQKAQAAQTKAAVDIQKSQVDLQTQQQKAELDLRTQAAKSTMEIQKARMMPKKESGSNGSQRS